MWFFLALLLLAASGACSIGNWYMSGLWISRRRLVSGMQHCIAPYVDIILHRGRFWAKSAASGSIRWRCLRSCWTMLSHVMSGCRQTFFRSLLLLKFLSDSHETVHTWSVCQLPIHKNCDFRLFKMLTLDLSLWNSSSGAIWNDRHLVYCYKSLKACPRGLQYRPRPCERWCPKFLLGKY